MAQIDGSPIGAGNGQEAPSGTEGLWSALFKASNVESAADWYNFNISELADGPSEKITENFELDASINPLKREEIINGLVRFDESELGPQVEELLANAGAAMYPSVFGDLVGTWAPNNTSLSHLSVTHRCSIQRDANDKFWLWWYTSPLVSLGDDKKPLSAALWRISTILSPATYLAEHSQWAIAFPDRFPGTVFAQLAKEVSHFYRPDDSGMIDVIRVPLRVDLGYLIPLEAEDDAIVRAVQLAIAVGNRVGETLEDGYTNHKVDPGFSFHEVLLSGAKAQVKSHEDELRVAAERSGQLWIPSTRVFEYPGVWPADWARN
jgi:hypothetical protein